MDYVNAVETYYREASTYVSKCLDRWIAETRAMYEAMAQTEIQTYQSERNDVMQEIRATAARSY